MTNVYADFAAATPIDRAVSQLINRAQQSFFANPSAVHQDGLRAHASLEKARRKVADFLSCSPEEIYFSSSGTAANNLAILGYARANRKRGTHLITTSIDHPSVTNACLALKRDGFQVTYLPVDRLGLVSPDHLRRALTKKTILVSIHLANSVLGVIQPIKELSEVMKNHPAVFHTDACQAAAYLPLSVERLGVDLLTFNGGKIYAGRGAAVLYVRNNLDIFPIFYGGGQEGSLISGTENLPAIIGLAKAVAIVADRSDRDSDRIGRLRHRLQAQLLKIDGVQINLATSNRLPNHLSVTLNNCSDGPIVPAFSRLGISLSAASACSSRDFSQTSIYRSIGLTDRQANATVRISLGRSNSKQDLERIIVAVKKISRP